MQMSVIRQNGFRQYTCMTETSLLEALVSVVVFAIVFKFCVFTCKVESTEISRPLALYPLAYPPRFDITQTTTIASK